MSAPIPNVYIVKGTKESIEPLATLAAECHFIGIGKIKIQEKLTESTYTPEGCPPPDPITEPIDTSERYLVFTADSLNSLCPRSSYTLTIHQYNNVDCKCKNVGPLLAGVNGIISESISIGIRGELTNDLVSDNIPLALLPT